MNKSKAEELAYQYATGNGRASFPDTYEEKAFIAGWEARDKLAKEEVIELRELVVNAHNSAIDDCINRLGNRYGAAVKMDLLLMKTKKRD